MSSLDDTTVIILLKGLKSHERERAPFLEYSTSQVLFPFEDCHLLRFTKHDHFGLGHS